MKEFLNFINGEYVRNASGKTFENRNPVDHSLIGRVHEAGRPEVDAAVAAARAALKGDWGRMSVVERCKLLDALAAGLDDILGWPKQQGGRFDGPTEVLLGGKSGYVRPQDRPAMQALFPAARFEIVEGAGHWAHAEQPERFLALLRGALA